MSKTHRVLFIDDERKLNTVQGVRYREMVGLRPFTTAEKEVLRGHPHVDVARNYDEAISFLSAHSYDMVLFDHDLGPGKNGMSVAKWVVENIKEPFLHYVHSANVVGRINIDSLIGQYFDSLRAERIPALIVEYKKQTATLSAVHQIVKLPAYQELINLGMLCMPYILEDMEQNGTDWHVALATITGDNPITEEIAGRIPEMVQRWCDFLRVKYATYLSLYGRPDRVSSNQKND
jgi:hypothetical protein